MKTKTFARALLTGVSIAAATTALAQENPAPSANNSAEAQPAEEQEIVVVGTQIRGARVNDILPVTVLQTEDIEAAAPTSGDELFRSIPQNGDIAFNESRDAGGINDARGDTASINLRALGTGSTLVLLNGRRMVLHPGTQAENLVPVQSVNVNAIPVLGVERIEVLRDGASAIYGTDAVAGVVNTVLKNRFDGVTVEAEVSLTDNSDQEEYELSFEGGHTFNQGRTNISVFGSWSDRDPLYARERRNSRSSDMRPLLVGTPFENDTDFDNTSIDTPWAEFQRLNANFTTSTTAVRVDNVLLTTNGLFHVQPGSNPGCITTVVNGVCFDNSTLATTGEDRNLRYDINTERTLQGATERLNLFGFINHEFSDRLSFFGEIGYYHADYDAVRETETSLANQRMIVPANSPFNPLGPVGSPARLAGLTGVPNEGLNLELLDYRPIDVGPLTLNVDNVTTRFLGGFRGEMGGWDWETAALYSRARSNDTMQTISATLFQQALLANYNPFTGGDPNDPRRADNSPNPETVTSGMVVDIFRINTTSLTMADLKVSRSDLFQLPAGPVGFGAGIEYRHETFEDDRDPRLDGTIAFVALDGSSNGSDVLGASPTPDSRGSRDVFSAYAEMILPVVSPEMEVPLIHSFDIQLAGRYESYTTFGDVAKPRIAASWRPAQWLQVRGAWSLGFRAPGLPQLFENGIQRSNTRTDWVRCEADLRAGRIANFDACTRTQSIVSNRSGSQDLVPEESENFTIGVTFEPPLPRRLGTLTLTADYWEIQQDNLIGIFGDSNALTLDYLLRVQGSSNPLVERVAPTAQDIADFAGTGLAPVGRVIQVIDNYVNLSPRKVTGYDLGLYYSVRNTGIGNFSLRLNAARLLDFFQEPGPGQAALIAAQAAGDIDGTINIVGAEDLVRENGRPKWRFSGSLTWRMNGFGLGWYTTYISSVFDTSATLADGTPFPVDDYMSHSVYAEYRLEDAGDLIDDFRIRLGVRNLTNELAPLADATFGYLGELHSNRGRQFYISARTRF